jgi:glucokinase
MFLAIIGAEAGHMGLRLLAKGGVYICGGITPKVTPTLFEKGMLAHTVEHQGHCYRKRHLDGRSYRMLVWTTANPVA